MLADNKTLWLPKRHATVFWSVWEGLRTEQAVVEKVYLVQEVAEILRVTEKVVRQMCQSGDLSAKKLGGEWRIGWLGLQRIVDELNGVASNADRPNGDPSAAVSGEAA